MTIPSKGEAAEKGECSVVVACSDFQDPVCKSGNASSYGNGMETVKSLLSQVSSNYINIDGLICCGDYCYDTTRG
ncbi:MAG: hypothetical protein MJ231_07935 [bacterium]|nr:hypothetical protein [bacterium]